MAGHKSLIIIYDEVLLTKLILNKETWCQKKYFASLSYILWATRVVGLI